MNAALGKEETGKKSDPFKISRKTSEGLGRAAGIVLDTHAAPFLAESAIKAPVAGNATTAKLMDKGKDLAQQHPGIATEFTETVDDFGGSAFIPNSIFGRGKMLYDAYKEARELNEKD